MSRLAASVIFRSLVRENGSQEKSSSTTFDAAQSIPTVGRAQRTNIAIHAFLFGRLDAPPIVSPDSITLKPSHHRGSARHVLHWFANFRILWYEADGAGSEWGNPKSHCTTAKSFSHENESTQIVIASRC